ncbi:MAG: patatin family protein, partial [Ruminiclostridium sp.]|nr:patatin family protein [Ruminiclostridium sp.]
MKTGLVLEGGAMRGMYTAGALDVLLENDINFDGIIGTSAGAVFGVNF